VTASIADRVDAFDWTAVSTDLDQVGVGLTTQLLTVGECRTLIESYDHDDSYRSTIDMERYRFGEGQYRYFDYPLPDLVGQLRAAFWPHLLPIAREWATRSGHPTPWPDDLEDWLEQCHGAGQERPTPLILRYGPGDWNALHRDLYGDLVFPLQVVVALNRPQEDFTGGEFVVVEQRPRSQSRATVTQIPHGHGLVFTTRDRPVKSSKGWSDGPMRHGLSTVRSGQRHALGLVFHDAT
jgi:hypothetical protein